MISALFSVSTRLRFGGIDGGGRIDHVHLLGKFPDVVQRHLRAGHFSHRDFRLRDREKSFLLDLQRVVARREAGEFLAAGVVGLTLHRLFRMGSQCDARGRNCRAVFVHDLYA